MEEEQNISPGDWEDEPEWTQEDLELVYLWIDWCIRTALGEDQNRGIDLPRDSSE